VISDIYSDDMLVKQQGNYVCGDGGDFSVLDKIDKAIIGTFEVILINNRSF